MRTTLGTKLARAGVAPQIAQRIMQHADYRTTLKQNAVLDLSDMAAAIRQLSTIQTEDRHVAAATGTDHATPAIAPRNTAKQLGRETMRNSAGQRGHGSSRSANVEAEKPNVNAAGCRTTRSGATIHSNAAGVTQLVEYQPSKLNVAGSTPVARFSQSSFPPPFIAVAQGLTAMRESYHVCHQVPTDTLYPPPKTT